MGDKVAAPEQNGGTRTLSDKERNLARWMLEHGLPEAQSFLPQLERAEATTLRCPCGCATLHFKVSDLPEAPPGVCILADFTYGPSETPNGIFIFASNGILSGLEVFSYTGNHPLTLPDIAELRPVAVPPSHDRTLQ